MSAIDSFCPAPLKERLFRRWVRWIYVILFAALLALPAVGTALNPRGRTLGHERIASFPEWSARAWFNGSFQRGFEEWFAQAIRPRWFLIRLANQINFSVFSELTSKLSSQIVLGKGNALFEAVYVDSYNGVGALRDAEIDAFARDLRRLQDYLERNGVGFLFFITPSKASIYPEWLPDAMNLRLKQKIRSDYEALLPQLESHGVHTLDSHVLLESLKQKSGYPVFPKGGTHWNHFASFCVTQELGLTLEHLLGRPLVRMRLGGVRIEKKALGSDGDLANLVTMWDTTPFESEQAHPVASRVAPPGARPVNALVVGGSFLDLPLHWLRSFGVVSDQTDFNGYFKRKLGDIQKEVLSRDVVILETNEQAISNRGHGLIEALLPPESR